MAEACREQGYTTYRSDFRAYSDTGTILERLTTWRRLSREGAKMCRSHGIQAVHVNSAAPAQWMVPVALFQGLPVLVHLHTHYLRRSRYLCLLHAATSVIGVSRQVLEGPTADRIGADRLKVIYNGVDFARAEAADGNLGGASLRESLGISEDAFVVAAAGSLIARKGYDVLIRAVHAMRSDAMRSHLVIAGDGVERASLEVLVRDLGLDGRVHFLGHVADLQRLYTTANVFALASRYDSFALVLAEAGHHGLASVATRVGGIPEVIADGETGLLVPPDDAEAMTQALCLLRDEPATRARMACAAAARVDAHFSIERMARQFEQTYCDLVDLPPKRRGLRSLRGALPSYFRLFRLTGTKI